MLGTVVMTGIRCPGSCGVLLRCPENYITPGPATGGAPLLDRLLETTPQDIDR